MMKMKYWIGLVLVACATLVKAEEVAVPAAINYQGRLTNPEDGTAVATGVYHLEFRVWDHPTETSASHLIWGRVFAVHVVTNGLFNVLLTDDGAELSSPSPQVNDLRQAFQGENRYLGLKITQGPSGIITAPEIKPRQKMVSSPFAFHAQNAVNSAQLGRVDASKYYNDNRFDLLGLSSDYARLLGWTSGGNAVGLGMYGYSNRLCLTSGSPISPAAGTRLMIQDGNFVMKDGNIVPQIGHDNGIIFPYNIGGGAGDAAGLTYHVATAPEDCELRLFVNNDNGDRIRIESSGDIQIAAAETLKLKNANQVELLGKVGKGYLIGKKYKAKGDGMLTFYGYHGEVRFYQKQENGTIITDGDNGHDYWSYFFYKDDADSMTMTIPLAKGDIFHFEYAPAHNPLHWKIRWRPFGNADLEEVP